MIRYYKSKVDWWIYAIVLITALVIIPGPMITQDYWLGIGMVFFFAGIEIVTFSSIKYAIRENALGIRSFYCWKWYPIDKITKVKKVSGILSAPALSTSRVAIRFSDPKILKSSSALEISPKDRDGFIAELKALNPQITVG